jgi:superfamily I DNA/RNA helicase
MHIVLGPPGTGKTTTLLKLVEKHLKQGTPPDRIGYFAFTKRAAQEAIQRACSAFNIEKRDLPYFRTLHSLAFLQGGFKQSQIMKGKEYANISEWLKIGRFFNEGSTDQGPYKDFGYGDKFLEIINISRILRQPLQRVYKESIVPLKTNWNKVEYVNRGIRHWKDSFGLFDYTDMLETFLKRDLAPKLDVVFIDEAQDLSPIQWEMVKKLEEKSKICYVAGDDDQAIFRYAGADVEYFVNLKGETTFLTQSFRIPISHHFLSAEVIKRVVGRRKKSFSPKQDSGKVYWHKHSEQVDVSQGEWLLLSRTTRGAQQIEEEIRKRGHLYTYNGSKSIDTNVIEAVRLWESLREGSSLNPTQVRLVYKHMNINTEVAYGYKTMPKADEERYYSLQELQQDYGLLHSRKWDEGLGKISDKDKVYIKACLRKGEKLTEKPRIRISTIHSSKGSQSENVLLLTETMRRPYSMWRKNTSFEEDEARVFYVGLTRSQKNLHLIHPMFSQGYPLPVR